MGVGGGGWGWVGVGGGGGGCLSTFKQNSPSFLAMSKMILVKE